MCFEMCGCVMRYMDVLCGSWMWCLVVFTRVMWCLVVLLGCLMVLLGVDGVLYHTDAHMSVSL